MQEVLLFMQSKFEAESLPLSKSVSQCVRSLTLFRTSEGGKLHVVLFQLLHLRVVHLQGAASVIHQISF